MKRVQAVIRPDKLDSVQHRLAELGFVGLMVYDVRGHGSEAESSGEWRGVSYRMSVKHKLLVDLLVEDDEVMPVVDAIRERAATGSPGDGIVFVLEVPAVYPIRQEAPAQP
ncbi:MAG: P-II family nitrogen regulator [Acidimicrobiia bacterium]